MLKSLKHNSQRNILPAVLIHYTPNISMHILHTVLYTFPKRLTRRICFTIKSCFSWWSSLLFSWLSCLIQGWYCKEKLDASNSERLRVNFWNPKSDQHINVLQDHENKGNDGQTKKIWLLNKFSISVWKEMYSEEYGEFRAKMGNILCSQSTHDCNNEIIRWYYYYH